MITMFNKGLISIITLILLISCEKYKENEDTVNLFDYLKTDQTHIDFKNVVENKPKLNILNYLYFYNGSGVAIADFNNDNLPDIYFAANQSEDALYINLGDLKFKNTTKTSKIVNDQGWTTGVSTVDINNDGLMDIYVCKVGDYLGIKGKNMLYVNQGLNEEGIPFFKESAKEYSLDFIGFSTQSAFFDYDLDGDLDMFLLNHSVHPNRTYGHGRKRNQIDQASGDKLFRNESGKFRDVTQSSGIFQGKIGYGLGVSISDINNDGYPDIYVGNDFFENDYLYINQKDGTFKDVISSDNTSFGHTSHFSMGNDIADINNDGFADILSMDMLPEDLKTYKTSGLEYSYNIYQNYLKNGYDPQYMQNTLHLNEGVNLKFSEIAFISGLAATEWSWSPLIADFDNDGYKDIYITNGIVGATNDMDFISFIANENIQKKINKGMDLEDLDFIKKIPNKKINNYFFKNNGNNTFENISKQWAKPVSSYSNGASFSDLDNDGDLDIVVNNVNEPAFILRNNSDTIPSANFLKIKFKGDPLNVNGIGVKVKVYDGTKVLSQENFTTRGYLSSVEPNLHFGLGASKTIDSLEIIWPNGKYQTLKGVEPNQTLLISYSNALTTSYYQRNKTSQTFLTNTQPLFDFEHKDEATVEFNRDPLIPFASTNLGPDISVGDVNNDGLEDIFVSGSKRQASQLLVQQKDFSFSNSQQELFEIDNQSEDVSHTFFDANNDGFLDLIVVSGGNEYKTGTPLNPRLYINNRGNFVKDTTQFKNIYVNASKIAAVDIDRDGDLDLSITSNLLPWQFGVTPNQYIFKNDGKGKFKEITEEYSPQFKSVGNVQDMVWKDLNGDQYPDLIVVGHWMPITIFFNNGQTLELRTHNKLETSNGWYNVIKADDFDKDGDIDFVVGNWGLNSRLKASVNEPLKLYRNDFDENGSVEPVVTYFYKGEETPFASKDELVKQMPFLNKKYLSYSAFANAKFQEIFPKDKMDLALKKEVYELASCYYENLGNNTFKKHILPFKAQISTVYDIVVDDFNNDTFNDLLLVGNNYEISTQLGRLDASHGVLLINDKKGNFKEVKFQNFDVSGQARHIGEITLKGEKFFIVTRNNHTPVFLKKNNDTD